MKGARRLAATSMPSSSANSRINAASGVSPGSTLPPGNSQRPAIAFPSGRWASSTRPSASTNTTAATRTTGPATALSSSSSPDVFRASLWMGGSSLRLSGLEIVATSERLVRTLTQPEAPLARTCSGHPRLGDQDWRAEGRREWPGQARPRRFAVVRGALSATTIAQPDSCGSSATKARHKMGRKRHIAAVAAIDVDIAVGQVAGPHRGAPDPMPRSTAIANSRPSMWR